MSKHPRQATLLDIFSKSKRPTYEEDGDESSSDSETEEQDNESDSSGSESTDVMYLSICCLPLPLLGCTGDLFPPRGGEFHCQISYAS